MEKKWFTPREAAVYIGREVKELKKISVKGWIITYKIFSFTRFEKQSLDYFLNYQQERAP
jgi:hypothetical protein